MSNYGFDERDTMTGTTRENLQQPQHQQLPPQPMQYGYGQPQWPMQSPYGRRPFGWRGPTETKPFYLTSEFGMSILASIAIAISAATMHAFGGWRAWILIAAIVCSYNLSRGIAKSGTRSRAHDPREDMDLNFRRDRDQERDHALDGR